MASNAKEEPRTAPLPDRWYTLSLGSSLNNDTSDKYCTFRYDFKPASIDKSKPGSLHKHKDNRVSLEFENNQVGKSKVAFEGSSEDYKKDDAVLFFDGETFRLERLHRAVTRLRRLRVPGESAAPMESRLSPAARATKPVCISGISIPQFPVEVERIDVGEPDIPVAKGSGKALTESPSDQPQPNVFAASHVFKNDETEDNQDINIEDLFGSESPVAENPEEQKDDDICFDMNVRQHNDSDVDIADVDDIADEANKGKNAAETLRAQVKNVDDRNKETSSSSSSSGSGSSESVSESESSSSSSSSDSEGSDADTVNSI